MGELDPASRELLAGPNFAHLATTMRDGSPHSVPIWIGVEGDRVLFYREEDSIGFRNLRRDPRVAISIVDQRDPYRYAAVRGRVVAVREGPQACEWLHQLAIAYTGERYPAPGPLPGAVFVVEPERVMHVHLDGFTHAPPSSPAGHEPSRRRDA